MSAALDKIASASRGRRTRDHHPAQRLRDLIEAKRQAEAGNKTEAENAAGRGQVPGPRLYGRDQTVSDSSRSGSSQSTSTNQPAPIPAFEDMRQGFPAKDRPTSLDQLSNPISLPCAVMINKDGRVMGNPFGSMPGWAVKVDLDAGAHGQPSIGLDFEISKAGARSRKAKDRNTFAVGWEPGVAIGGKWMIEDLQMLEATNPPDPSWLTDTFPPAINGLLKKAKRDQTMLASNLICATFMSNVHKSSPIKMDWALAFNGDKGGTPYANLKSMYQGEGKSYQVTLWFVNRKLPLARFHTAYLDPLVDAVTDHTPPFHHFLDGNDEPMMDLNLEKIHPVSNGMYRRDPKVLDHTDRRVENRLGKLTRFRLRKIVRWQTIKTLHTRASIQYAQGGPGSPRGDPRKAPKSTADLEMLRLKDRQTLHRLDRS